MEMGLGRVRLQMFVDGLDECDDVGAQCEIIQIITATVSNGHLSLAMGFL